MFNKEAEMKALYEAESWFLCRMAKVKAGMKRFVQEEKGASDMVAILVVIVVVIGVAVIFRDKLGELIESIFTKAGTDLNGIGQYQKN